MRVKDFDDKIHEDLDFVWFFRKHFPETLTEGKRVDANARLLRLCHTAYNLGGTALEPNPKPVTPPTDAVITGVTAGGPADGTEDDGTTESPGDSGEGERDPP